MIESSTNTEQKLNVASFVVMGQCGIFCIYSFVVMGNIALIPSIYWTMRTPKLC